MTRLYQCAMMLLCLGGWIGTAEPAAAARPDARPPNVVFILADDSGFGDFGCYGHPYARTPNIDRLAAEGSRFTQFHATGVTCCPARTGLMTSRHPASFAVYPANGGFGDVPTVTALLKARGYQTGHFGKWHIGPDPKPGAYGIDVINAGDKPVGDKPDEKGKKDPARGRDAPIYDQAIQFIETHRDGPFYVNVWSHVSHHPVDPPASYVEHFAGVKIDEAKFGQMMWEKFDAVRAAGGDVSQHMQKYMADIQSMDDDIGRLLKRLDELGLSENTLVVFSSDQGPAPVRLDEAKAAEPKNAKQSAKAAAKKAEKNPDRQAASDPADENDRATDLRLNAMGYAGGLRGGKHTMLEGGLRVPFIVRWPGHVPAGRTDQTSVLSGLDWLPTLCKLAGVSIEAGKFEGFDVSSAWLGGTYDRTTPLFWKTSSPGSPTGIRDGDWKLFHPTNKRGDDELYDLSADPTESRNVAKDHPEVTQRLVAKVEQWTATLPKDYVKTGDKED